MTLDVWAVWPSANLEFTNRVAPLWHEMGYKTAVMIEADDRICVDIDWVIKRPKWQGFPKAMNHICGLVEGDIVVCVGDDIHPDPNKDAQQIGEEFLETFPDLFGVMQPTGDRFGLIDDCCPSPWIGRRFIEEAYAGSGPYWSEYYHYFSDGELKDVAELLGAFQQRRDLSQFHDHWQRRQGGTRPEYLLEAKEEWKADKALYLARTKNRFPRHERIET